MNQHQQMVVNTTNKKCQCDWKGNMFFLGPVIFKW